MLSSNLCLFLRTAQSFPQKHGNSLNLSFISMVWLHRKWRRKNKVIMYKISFLVASWSLSFPPVLIKCGHCIWCEWEAIPETKRPKFTCVSKHWSVHKTWNHRVDLSCKTRRRFCIVVASWQGELVPMKAVLPSTGAAGGPRRAQPQRNLHPSEQESCSLLTFPVLFSCSLPLYLLCFPEIW